MPKNLGVRTPPQQIVMAIPCMGVETAGGGEDVSPPVQMFERDVDQKPANFTFFQEYLKKILRCIFEIKWTKYEKKLKFAVGSFGPITLSPPTQKFVAAPVTPSKALNSHILRNYAIHICKI